jgi:hypothetical protein
MRQPPVQGAGRDEKTDPAAPVPNQSSFVPTAPEKRVAEVLALPSMSAAVHRGRVVHRPCIEIGCICRGTSYGDRRGSAQGAKEKLHGRPRTESFRDQERIVPAKTS